MTPYYLMAIDQGTTNSRTIIFDAQSQLVSMHEIELTQYYPKSGWVEHNPEEMFNNTILCCQEALKKANLAPTAIAAIGISNQRETTIIWDKQTGDAIYPAIVWQDRRTTEICNKIATIDLANQLAQKTGLLLDPYFSATKIMWILQNVPGAFERALKGELLFGTVDTYLLWKLTDGEIHATDVSNASRSMLYNINTNEWDDELLQTFSIPKILLPRVLDSAADFGKSAPRFFGTSILITGMAGDQQAAMIGQTCFTRGATKVTYGTGGFLFMNTGQSIVKSTTGLISTITYRLHNQISYGLEGSFFSAGVSVKWLRDTLKIIKSAADTERLARQIPDNGGVYFVPAFTGLGAPYWNSDVRASIFGLARNYGADYCARAALESVVYQTRDVLEAMLVDYSIDSLSLNVDGGMAVNNWLLQFLADITRVDIARPTCIESSALGVAYLAGLQVGLFRSLDDIVTHRKIDRIFKPTMSLQESNRLYAGWKDVIRKLLE